jgi:hypothetical protein
VRWLVMLLWTFLSLGAAQAEMSVSINFPDVVGLRSGELSPKELRTNKLRFNELSETSSSVGELFSHSTLQVFVKPDWQFLMSVKTSHARVYAQLSEEETVRLSQYPHSFGSGQGWQAVSLSYKHSSFSQNVDLEVEVTYSVVHP